MPSNAAIPNSMNDGSLRLASLTDTSKHEVWRYLSTRRKDLAAKLQEAADNPVIKILLEQHDATLVIDAEVLPRQLRASLSFAH